MENLSVTALLSEEHQYILKVISAVEKECAIAEDQTIIHEAFWLSIIDFVQNYADRFHHAKEEDILFKEMCRDDVPLPCNPVQQMLYEHEQGRKFVRQLIAALENKNLADMLDNARNYAMLLRSHIHKEDNILYPMADQALSQDVQDKMLAAFKQVEAEKFPADLKEKYQNFANNL